MDDELTGYSAGTLPTCVICLEPCINRCYSVPCMHVFCLGCLLEWSKIKAECPICKQLFRSIIYNIKSPNEYEEIAVYANVASDVSDTNSNDTSDSNSSDTSNTNSNVEGVQIRIHVIVNCVPHDEQIVAQPGNFVRDVLEECSDTDSDESSIVRPIRAEAVVEPPSRPSSPSAPSVNRIFENRHKEQNSRGKKRQTRVASFSESDSSDYKPKKYQESKLNKKLLKDKMKPKRDSSKDSDNKDNLPVSSSANRRKRGKYTMYGPRSVICPEALTKYQGDSSHYEVSNCAKKNQSSLGFSECNRSSSSYSVHKPCVKDSREGDKHKAGSSSSSSPPSRLSAPTPPFVNRIFENRHKEKNSRGKKRQTRVASSRGFDSHSNCKPKKYQERKRNKKLLKDKMKTKGEASKGSDNKDYLPLSSFANRRKRGKYIMYGPRSVIRPEDTKQALTKHEKESSHYEDSSYAKKNVSSLGLSECMQGDESRNRTSRSYSVHKPCVKDSRNDDKHKAGPSSSSSWLWNTRKKDSSINFWFSRPCPSESDSSDNYD